MTTYAELMNQIETLQKQADELRAKEKADVIAEIKKRIAEYGITASELGYAEIKRRTRRPAAPKYRNPATGETWSGRGRKPLWLAEALARGESLEKFAIGQPAATV